MLIAFLLAAVVWSSPAPQLYVCAPGHTPGPIPTTCERLHFHVLGKWQF